MISIRVETDPTFKGTNEPAAISIISHVLQSEGIETAEITLVFGSDELLSNLKKEFFNKEQFTDVIAFRLNDYEEKNVEGEVYISLPRAAENAEKFNEVPAKELGRLIIHGGLHLLGYEDKSEAEKKAMTKKEDYYLEQVDWSQLYG
ncbi:MAG: rRNA maturation RNase YbeY [Candidatus Marinimicrobia bacterium]|nr:rRNA maturation RNase YbeY [Candidatus Neomarinimicrobiota bacterium]MDP6610965.1 rRNA maturation RNase YbeY [Candidatus Neomarinimicrobiota bacterium]